MQTTGIYIEHNANGIPTFARIDLNKYGAELKEFFTMSGYWSRRINRKRRIVYTVEKNTITIYSARDHYDYK